MESVDAAARQVIADACYDAACKYFSQRLGHGIGMDMHKWYYLVHGELGVRLEEDVHVTEKARAGSPHRAHRSSSRSGRRPEVANAG